MKKLSANYTKSNNNFVVFNVEYLSSNKNKKYVQGIKIVKNILTRGTPTFASRFLEKKYEYDLSLDNQELYLVSNESAKWTNTIKGSETTLDNPALVFYNNIDQYFKSGSFIKQMIIPEVLINEIINEDNSEFREQTVDFFIPQAKLVIEIDGMQHENNVDFDAKRDDVLESKGFSVFRIKTIDINNNTQEFQNSIITIKNILYNNELIKLYSKCRGLEDIYNKGENKEIVRKLDLTSIARFQLTIIELLLNNHIFLEDKEWNFLIKTNHRIDFVDDALNDLILWFEKIFALQKITFKAPKININNKKLKNIIIDFDIFKRWSEECKTKKDVIYVRADYYDNKDRNHFEIDHDDSFQYELDEKEDREILKWFLNNIFRLRGNEEISFRDGQLPIIINVLNKRDTVGILPTGTGKSLCYQLPALLQPGISFIVSPLKSLINDQYDSMLRQHITNVTYIQSELSPDERKENMDKISNGKAIMFWITPERFQNEDFRERIKTINIEYNGSYAVIDEVHCMSEWGHDFRVSYLQLVKTIRQYLPQSILLGLTATASTNVITDLKIEFEIRENDIKTIDKFYRDEFTFHITECKEEEKEERLLQIIDKYSNMLNISNKFGMLVYSNFASGKFGVEGLCKNVSTKYNDFKNYFGHYSGSDNQSDQTKAIIQKKFKEDKLSLLFATKAFGMGIDKPNIRCTIHYGMPSSLEAFYQEVGRAGRDNKPAHSYIIHSIAADEYKKITEDRLRSDDNSQLSHNLYHKCDVLDHLILMTKNSLNVEYEANEIYLVYKELSKKDYSNIIDAHIIMKNRGETKNKILNEDDNDIKIEDAFNIAQNYAYKLSLMGIINDWTCDYKKRTLKIELNKIDIESIKDSINKYINQYERDFDIRNVDKHRYAKIYDIMNGKNDEVYKCIYSLLQWYNDKFIYNRKQALKNIDEVFQDLKSLKNPTEELNLILQDYFQPKGAATVLSYLRENEFSYQRVFKLMMEGTTNSLQTMKELNSIRTSLMRYLEESRYNFSLNLLSGLLSLLLNDYKSDDGELRLKEALHSLNEKTEEKAKFLNDILIFTKKHFNPTQKEDLSTTLLEYYEEFGEIKQIYKETESKGALLKILTRYNKQLEEIEEMVLHD